MKATMQSPEGEVREVEATEKELVPLMNTGWKQISARASSPADAPVIPAEEKR